MKKKEHIARHEFLHKALDELCADSIDRTGNLLSDTTVMDLMSWSSLQTKSPSVYDRKRKLDATNVNTPYRKGKKDTVEMIKACVSIFLGFNGYVLLLREF